MRSSLRFGVNPNQVGTNNFTDNLLESASYLRLRTITLSRVLPGSVTGKFGITNGRIYVTGRDGVTQVSVPVVAFAGRMACGVELDDVEVLCW